MSVESWFVPPFNRPKVGPIRLFYHQVLCLFSLASQDLFITRMQSVPRGVDPRGPPGTPIHPFTHFYLGNIYNLLCIVSQTRRWNHTHAKATLALTRLNHGPHRKADAPRGQFIEKNNEIAKNVS